MHCNFGGGYICVHIWSMHVIRNFSRTSKHIKSLWLWITYSYIFFVYSYIVCLKQFFWALKWKYKIRNLYIFKKLLLKSFCIVSVTLSGNMVRTIDVDINLMVVFLWELFNWNTLKVSYLIYLSFYDAVDSSNILIRLKQCLFILNLVKQIFRLHRI